MVVSQGLTRESSPCRSNCINICYFTFYINTHAGVINDDITGQKQCKCYVYSVSFVSLKVLTRWQSEQASATHEGAWHLVVGGAEYGLLLYWCSYYHNLLLLLLPSALLNNNEKTNKLGIYYSSHSLFVLKFAKSTSDEFRGSSRGGSFQIHLNNKRCILCILRSKYDPDMLGLCPGTESWIRRDYCLREPRCWENIIGWWMGTEGGVWLSCCPFSESERNEKLAQGLSHSWLKLKLLQSRDGEARRESLVWSLTRLWPVMRGGAAPLSLSGASQW